MALRSALAASAVGRAARGRLAIFSAEPQPLRCSAGDGALPGRASGLFSLAAAAGGRAEAWRGQAYLATQAAASSSVAHDAMRLSAPAAVAASASSSSGGGGWGRAAWRVLKYGVAAGAAYQTYNVFSSSIPQEEREWVE